MFALFIQGPKAKVINIWGRAERTLQITEAGSESFSFHSLNFRIRVYWQEYSLDFKQMLQDNNFYT